MKKGDKNLTPAIDFTDTKSNIEAFASPIEGMRAVSTDTHESGFYDGSIWVWGSGGGGIGGAFQRVLSSALTLADGECLLLTRYANLNSHNLVLRGDAELRIL
jgi:hypothetical protein